ncbi:Prefoldin subunit-domain-containing protein [Aspergillus pseudonomiae]|uniref:Prefoldin subunit-domain-containing protein n=1 Tax=Aspergillus pseudonomiae TaxID=1506151 RepID=A0A5N7D3T3_9EURO|nr:Prefoldin subunit-domain-containing protein [Aspergillus pseudonomiae]KAB8265787.1 Prefoldin subunit-domain-containing protein [Aspergillus pseudonomiae]KAE8401066.1 Prefoldin subunit-domain-containing protein [Aspergillus pseudonomiae]
MGVPGSNLQDLERQRLELEGNILKLQESLYHWRTWEAEYDALKDEISELDDDATMDDFLRIGRDFGGSLVTEDEVKVILGEKQGVARTKQQVIDLVSRRVDYVKQNVTTMEKRLRSVENQLHAFDSAEQLPTEPTSDFPMTEIVEELDEDGNVISSSTATPGDQAPELLELLKKAGVNDVPDAPNANAQPGYKAKDGSSSADKEHGDISEKPSLRETNGSSVAYSEEKPAASDLATEKQEELPVTDIDESPEDAKLRREMLQYQLNEVGAVVAELELDEDASDISIDDDYDAFAYDDEDEEEDEYGRSTRTVLSEDYHQQMRELEAKLNARGMWNMGKDTGSLPVEVQKELEQPSMVRIEKSTETVNEPAPEKKPKKKVAFADDLDIAPAPKPPIVEKKAVAPRQSDVPVLSDAVVERTQSTVKDPITNDVPKKTSRFKSARSTTGSENSIRPTEARSSLRKPITSPSPTLPLFPAKPSEPKPFSQPISDITEAPRGPEGKILADTLVEHEVSQGAAMPPELDEIDEQIHRKEIASEFYRIRNRMIQQNGGFVGGEEPETVPIETEDPPKRVSRFRAARMT